MKEEIIKKIIDTCLIYNLKEKNKELNLTVNCLGVTIGLFIILTVYLLIKLYGY